VKHKKAAVGQVRCRVTGDYHTLSVLAQNALLSFALPHLNVARVLLIYAIKYCVLTYLLTYLLTARMRRLVRVG